MKLRDKIKESTIISPMSASTQQDAIDELLLHLKTINKLSSTSQICSNIKNNEKNMPSAAGRGVAYPHSTSMEIKELTCVLGLSKEGIDFKSPDGQLCHIILLTLSPNIDPSEHRKFITQFRIMINNPHIRYELLESTQINQIISIIDKWEDDDALNNNIN